MIRVDWWWDTLKTWVLVRATAQPSPAVVCENVPANGPGWVMLVW